MDYFKTDRKSAYEAKAEAQRIAWSPIVFQACRLLRNSGILRRVKKSGEHGITLQEVATMTEMSPYGIKVLMEAGLGIGLFCLNDDRFSLTKLGYFMLSDPMTQVNMDVMHEVCYRGFFHLDQAIAEGKPAGLKTLGDWETLYEGLSSFSPEARRSWLAFDHYYSDFAFPAALPLVFQNESAPRRLLDVGGNTGKWAIQCAEHNADVHVTIADLPQQIALARQSIREQGLENRVDFHPLDIRDESQPLPEGYDVIWMSQFLDCFSQEEIISILRRAARAMSEQTSLYIMELFWDRQANETAAFSLQQISLYFTCIANGNSQMYHSGDILRCLEQTGFSVVRDVNEVGHYHTLLECRLK